MLCRLTCRPILNLDHKVDIEDKMWKRILEHPSSVAKYLALINYKGSLKPNLQTLSKLTWAHKTAVPYSNLNFVNGQKIDFNLNRAFKDMVMDRQGVMCYQTCGLFAWLLCQLGFEASLFSACFTLDKRMTFSEWGAHVFVCVSIYLFAKHR